jgi:LysR family glycine cleavage system transcriptional activator
MPIPSLGGFQAFEAAARHLSFTLAGEELFVTQAAISQRIKQLETQLGFKLFLRQVRQLALTEEGAQLAPVVTRSIGAIAQAIVAVNADQKCGPLTVSTLSSFAMKWLIPRLADFNLHYPEIQLRIHTGDAVVDFNSGGIDLAIRYAAKEISGLYSVPLMVDEVFPVCSPALLASGKTLRKPGDLKNFVLIHDESDSSRFGHPNCSGLDWETWCRAVGADINTHTGLFFNQGDQVVQAAVAGQGVAITRTSLAQDDIAAGRLIRLFKSNVMASAGYSIVCRDDMLQSTKIVAFREWLLQQAEMVSVTAT